MTEYLTFDEVLTIAEEVLGGYVVADAGLLKSAVVRPQMSAFGDDAYPTLAGKAAALLHSIARNHCLLDGNKRLAFMVAYTFCGLNDYRLAPPDVNTGEAVVLAVAVGTLDVPELTPILDGWLSYVAPPFGQKGRRGALRLRGSRDFPIRVRGRG